MISYSIIISVYDQVETLKLSLASLKNQIKTPKAFEIVVADDASSDATDDFVRKLRYPIFLKYSRSETNQGRALNRNRGFQKAAGKWLIFIDGDMVPGPDFISAYLKAWNEFPDAVSLGSFGHPPGISVTRWHRYLESRGRLVMKHGDTVPGKYFTSGNFSIKKALLEKLGGFDMSFAGWGGEDTDFGFRLEKNSVSSRYIPDAFCQHYHQKKLEDVIAEYEKFGRNGYPRLIRKHPDKIIFEKGWLLGMPDSTSSPARRVISAILAPLRTRPVLGFLKWIAGIGRGKILNDFLCDWLFYGHVARGYMHRER